MTDKPYATQYRKTALIEATQWWRMGQHPAVVINSDGIPWIETLEGGPCRLRLSPRSHRVP